MKPTRRGFELSTGRTFYANQNIVGIDPDLDLSEGFDSGMEISSDWTAEERAELADYMIDLWSRFKAKPGEKP
jgi:hypothetical protein